jgi:hypothetical protein
MYLCDSLLRRHVVLLLCTVSNGKESHEHARFYPTLRSKVRFLLYVTTKITIDGLIGN